MKKTAFTLLLLLMLICDNTFSAYFSLPIKDNTSSYNYTTSDISSQFNSLAEEWYSRLENIDIYSANDSLSEQQRAEMAEKFGVSPDKLFATTTGTKNGNLLANIWNIMSSVALNLNMNSAYHTSSYWKVWDNEDEFVNYYYNKRTTLDGKPIKEYFNEQNYRTLFRAFKILKLDAYIMMAGLQYQGAVTSAVDLARNNGFAYGVSGAPWENAKPDIESIITLFGNNLENVKDEYSWLYWLGNSGKNAPYSTMEEFWNRAITTYTDTSGSKVRNIENVEKAVRFIFSPSNDETLNKQKRNLYTLQAVVTTAINVNGGGSTISAKINSIGKDRVLEELKNDAVTEEFLKEFLSEYIDSNVKEYDNLNSTQKRLLTMIKHIDWGSCCSGEAKFPVSVTKQIIDSVKTLESTPVEQKAVEMSAFISQYFSNIKQLREQQGKSLWHTNDIRNYIYPLDANKDNTVNGTDNLPDDMREMVNIMYALFMYTTKNQEQAMKISQSGCGHACLLLGYPSNIFIKHYENIHK